MLIVRFFKVTNENYFPYQLYISTLFIIYYAEFDFNRKLQLIRNACTFYGRVQYIMLI